MSDCRFQMFLEICKQRNFCQISLPNFVFVCFQQFVKKFRAEEKVGCKLELSAGLRMDKVDLCFPLFAHTIIVIISIIYIITYSHLFSFFHLRRFYIFIDTYKICCHSSSPSIYINSYKFSFSYILSVLAMKPELQRQFGISFIHFHFPLQISWHDDGDDGDDNDDGHDENDGFLWKVVIA